MRYTPRRTLSWLATAALSMLILSATLAGCGTGAQPQQSSGITSTSTATVEQVASPMPAPVGTFDVPLIVSPVPEPTLGRVVFPEPPAAHSFVSNVVENANIAWAVNAGDNTTIWAARYENTLIPRIADAKAIASWVPTEQFAVRVVDIEVSPDNRSLAVLTRLSLLGHDEYIEPTFLYVVDLATNVTRSVPDYYRHYEVYAAYYRDWTESLAGWIDNQSFVVQQGGSFSPKVVASDGSSLLKLSFPPAHVTTQRSILSPDRRKIFSEIIGSETSGVESGLWIYDVDGSNPVKISGYQTTYTPTWSPDGRFIAYVTPAQVTQHGTTGADPLQPGVWVLDVATGISREVEGDGTWDVAPSWAPDSTQLAFLRADPDAKRGSQPGTLPSQKATNVFVANVRDLKPQQLTRLEGMKNSNIVWAKDGSIVVPSSPAAGNGRPTATTVSKGATRSLQFGDLAPGSTIVSLVIFQ